MKRLPSDEPKGENTFGRSCVRLRQSMGLTQRALGRLLGISEQAIQHWEHDVYFPTQEHLERLLVLGLQRHAFVPGREQEEAHQLWRVAGQQVDFESFWMRAQAVSTRSTPGTGSYSGRCGRTRGWSTSRGRTSAS